MNGRVRNGARFAALALLAPLVAACTTTDTPPPVVAPAKVAAAPATDAPVSGSTGSGFGGFLTGAPVNHVDASLAQPCITAAANKYFLPEKVITAVDSRPGANGGTDVDLKVDLRTATCSLSAKGSVRSVYDTSPKSADQVAAEAAAAKAAAQPAAAPKKSKKN